MWATQRNPSPAQHPPDNDVFEAEDFIPLGFRVVGSNVEFDCSGDVHMCLKRALQVDKG